MRIRNNGNSGVHRKSDSCFSFRWSVGRFCGTPVKQKSFGKKKTCDKRVQNIAVSGNEKEVEKRKSL